MNVYVNGEVVKTLVGAHAQAQARARARRLPRLSQPCDPSRRRADRPQVGRAADCCPGLPSLQMTVPALRGRSSRPRKVGMSDHLPALFRLGDEGEASLADP